jgi:hypothetical protein
MSMSYDEAAREQYLEDLYEEHRKVAIDEFTSECLSSYYSENKLLAKPAFEALSDARELSALKPTASLVFAAIAMEVGLKAILLKPIVYGLVHTNSVASLITDLALAHTGVDRYKKLLFRLLRDHGGLDLDTFTRSGSNKTLWEEISEIQTARNAIMHRAEKGSPEMAERALSVASEIIDHIFPGIVKGMGFHLHDGYRICADPHCEFKGTPFEQYFKST